MLKWLILSTNIGGFAVIDTILSKNFCAFSLLTYYSKNYIIVEVAH